MEQRGDRPDDKAGAPAGQGTPTLVPTLSLPKGGGALRGIGETFQAASATGTGTLSVPIAISPGRGGFGPQLALTYDSGAGNGPFGLGWGLGLPSIARTTRRGLPVYEDEADGDTYVLAGAEDLVPVRGPDGSRDVVVDPVYTAQGGAHDVYRYRPRVEGLFARIERWVRRADGDTHWRVITGDNVTTIYGAAASARIAHPSVPGRVFEWLIDRSYDDRGNIVVYDYKPEDAAAVDVRLPAEEGRLRTGRAFAQRYLKRVRYGNSRPYLIHRNRPGAPGDFDAAAWQAENRWRFELVFDYGEHGDDSIRGGPAAWPVRRDPFSTYRPGFEVRTYRLCRRILMFHHFEEIGPEPRLVRSTVLRYDGDPGDPGNPSATQLVEVVHVGHEEGQPPAPTPGLRFGYSRARVSDAVHEIPGGAVHQLPDGRSSHWIDLDGEGLSGILNQRDGAWFYQRNDGGGRFASPRLVASLPSVAASVAPAMQLVDLGGDGRLNLVTWSPGLAGTHELGAAGEWEPFAAFEDVPHIDWDDPHLRFVDLTGDGHPDLLVTDDDCLWWHPSHADAGYGPARRAAAVLDEERGPAVVFADRTESIFLADMSGDGLTDVVRIRNGEVCYWPNTGHGTFGARVTMNGPPRMDDAGGFDPRRIRLGDIDGSGPADILYLGQDAVRYWLNQAGNGWSEEHRIAGFPRVDDLVRVQLLDLLGHGTDCLVWTSERPADRPVPIHYVPLMSDGKPYLLTEVDNGMGAVTRVAYAPSTRFHLQDRLDGRPWITRLPFPVHVVERVETHDAISGTRFVARYAYHHGFFDGVDREFRGFGMVEQWDSERYPERSGLDEAAHVPPVHTRTWFHTGSYQDRRRISRQYEREYFDGDPDALPLGDTELPPGLTAEEERQACRALKGRPLRQEVRALDEGPQHPYSVVETRYQVRLEQPQSGRHDAVFHVWSAETLTSQYERNPADPRVAHELTLRVDRYGGVRQSASVVYPRRRPELPEQGRMLITSTESVPIHLDESPWTYRIGLPFEAKTYEIRGAERPERWNREALVAVMDGALEAPFTSGPSAAGDRPDRRLLAHSRVRYYRDRLDPSDPMPAGHADSLGITHERFTLAFTQDILDQPQLGGRITAALLAEGGYRNDVDGDASHWWVPSGLLLFDAERAHEMFYLPGGARDALGARSSIGWDEPHFLFPVEVVDPLGNRVAARHDYRVLAPFLVGDSNGNRTRVVFDTRGMVIATAVMGKEGETDPRSMGDDVSAYIRRPEPTDGSGIPLGQASGIFADPGASLQQATTFFYYDLFAWRRDGAPAAAVGLAREVHGPDGSAAPARIQASVTYSDGFGRSILAKVQAEDGLAPEYDASGNLVLDQHRAPRTAWNTDRWVGSGATVFNNKGLPVRSYEPFFDSRPDFTRQEALVHIGVSPTLHYDPLGRVVRTVFPDGSFSRVEFGPWHRESHDRNDTVLDSPWHAERLRPEAAPGDRDAARKAGAHHATPTRLYLDTLGRPIVSIAHNRRRYRDGDGGFRVEDEFIPTRTELDIEGNTVAIHDGRRCEGLTLEQAVHHRGNRVTSCTHAMGGRRIEEQGMDAGGRWMLADVAGQAIHSWDERGHHVQTLHDQLQRPTEVRVDRPRADGGTDTITTERLVYGDELEDGDARRRNLRGKLYLHFDGAGLVKNAAFDFKGNLLKSVRRLADRPDAPDWSSLGLMAVDAMEATPLLEAESFATQTAYDALNRPVRIAGPDRSIRLPRYTKANLLEAMDVHVRGAGDATAVVQAIEYNARGQRTFIRRGNEVTTSYTYDASTFRLVRMHSTHNGRSLQELRYTYDPVGNLTEVRDDAMAPVYFANEVVEPASRFTCDPLYRLIEATGRESAATASAPGPGEIPQLERIPAHDLALRNYTQHYDHDPAGNLLRLRHVADGGGWTRAQAYEEGSNRLLSGGTDGDAARERYAHDAGGNLRSLPHLSALSWDHAGQLVHAAVAPGDEVFFTYDSQRRRIRKVHVHEGVRTERVYLDGVELYRRYQAADADARDELETLHVVEGSGRVCMVETPTRDDGADVARPDPRFRYQLGNHLGSATVELDHLADVITYEEYHPYGTTAYHARNGTIQVSAKRYRYTGMERDEETGLGYHTARYYAPWLARWCSADPAGLADGANLYRYTTNPVGAIDPGGTNGHRPHLDVDLELEVDTGALELDLEPAEEAADAAPEEATDTGFAHGTGETEPREEFELELPPNTTSYFPAPDLGEVILLALFPLAVDAALQSHQRFVTHSAGGIYVIGALLRGDIEVESLLVLEMPEELTDASFRQLAGLAEDVEIHANLGDFVPRFRVSPRVFADSQGGGATVRFEYQLHGEVVRDLFADVSVGGDAPRVSVTAPQPEGQFAEITAGVLFSLSTGTPSAYLRAEIGTRFEGGVVAGIYQVEADPIEQDVSLTAGAMVGARFDAGVTLSTSAEFRARLRNRFGVRIVQEAVAGPPHTDIRAPLRRLRY